MKTLNYSDLILPDGDKRYRSLEIKDNGDFEFEQTDYGQATKKIAPNGGDSDYETWITIKAENINSVLLELVRDSFDEQGEFVKWLKGKNIEYEFYSY